MVEVVARLGLLIVILDYNLPLQKKDHIYALEFCEIKLKYFDEKVWIIKVSYHLRLFYMLLYIIL